MQIIQKYSSVTLLNYIFKISLLALVVGYMWIAMVGSSEVVVVRYCSELQFSSSQ
jgi:hypothetical protein